MLCCKNTYSKGEVQSCSVLTPFRVTEEVTAKLMESAYHQIERDGILATRLCTHKDDVELTNENKLQQLPGVNSSIGLLSFFPARNRCYFVVSSENWQNCHQRVMFGDLPETIFPFLEVSSASAGHILFSVVSCSALLLICKL